MTEVWSCPPPPPPPPLLDASLCLETSYFARGTKSGGLFLEIDDGKEGAILKISDNPSLKK